MEQIYKKYVRYDPTCSHCYELQSVNLNKTFWERLFVTTLKSNRLYPLQDVHNLLPVKRSTSPCSLRISPNISSKIGSTSSLNHKKRHSSNFINITSLENELSLNDALHSKISKAHPKLPKIKPVQEVVELSPFNECWPEPSWESCINNDGSPVSNVKTQAPQIFNCRHVSKAPSLPTILETQNMEPSTGNSSSPEAKKGTKSSSIKSLRNSGTSPIPFKQDKSSRVSPPPIKQRNIKVTHVNTFSPLKKTLTEHLEAVDDLEVTSKSDKKSNSLKLQESSGSILKSYQSTASSWSSFLTPQENSNTLEGKQPSSTGDDFHTENDKPLPILKEDLIDTLCPSESLIKILNSNSSIPVLKRIKLYEDMQKNCSEKSKDTSECTINNVSSSLKESSHTLPNTTGTKSQKSPVDEFIPKTSNISRKISSSKSHASKTQQIDSNKIIQPPNNASVHQVHNKTVTEKQLLYLSGVLKERS